MRLLIVGHGRMGQLVERLAGDYEFDVAGILEIDSNPDGTGVTPQRCRDVDVAVDFSTAEATLATAPRLAAALRPGPRRPNNGCSQGHPRRSTRE